MKPEELEKYKKAGEIARKVKDYAKTIIKPGMKLLDIAEKIENKIEELGGKPAFPVNLAINDIAAHYTPTLDDTTEATGLLKIDIGVQIQGYIADTAFSLDLENNEENKKLIQASQEALESAIQIIHKDIELWKIGQVIQETISHYNFSPIRNLSGHELKQYILHAGLSIPNCNNNNNNKLPEGAYAIEPFATSGTGIVYDGKPSTIYKLEKTGALRDSTAREVLKFIQEEYETLPFCERWLVKKFTSKAKLALRQMEQAKILHHFPQLVEKSHGKVSQAEHTIIISDKIEVIS